MEPTRTGIKTWQWVVTVIVIIALIILGYTMFKGNETVTTDTTGGTDQSSLIKAGNINRVVVSDQFPGNVIYISSVQLAQPGFVVIHADNNGVPGAVLGYQYFDKGINPGKITLTGATVEGKAYYAMLHSDDGDKKFDITKDLPLKDAAGNVIMMLFRASTSISEVKG